MGDRGKLDGDAASMERAGSDQIKYLKNKGNVIILALYLPL
jgi:hypothetical protein